MSTDPGLPGFRPRICPVGTLTVTVTSPEIREIFVMARLDEAFVTSMPLMTPEPPGVTNAVCWCGTMAICGYLPVFNVTCANTQGGVVCVRFGLLRQVWESLLRSSRK